MTSYREYELIADTTDVFIESSCLPRCGWVVVHTHAQCLRCRHRQHIPLNVFSHYAAQLLVEHCREHALFWNALGGDDGSFNGEFELGRDT